SEQGGTDYSVVFQPNAAMTQDTTYTLPADGGTNGQILITDGSGLLSWTTAGGAVTSADITNDEIVNDDINSGAAIATTKISGAVASITGHGLGSMATQDSTSVSISGGSINGITDLALADGGTGASLTDPGADRILFWDDSAGAVAFLTPNTNLSITDTDLDGSGGGASNLVDLGDVGTSTATTGNMLIADGTDWDSQAMSGDAAITSGGALTIANDVVDLAKMAPGTAGNVITYDAGGNPAAVVTGNSGEVLTSNGAGAAPTFQAAGGGSGDFTDVNAGTGLSVSAGAATGPNVTLEADTTYLQRRVSATCAAGSSIREIAADGSVTCEIDDSGGGSGYTTYTNNVGSGLIVASCGGGEAVLMGGCITTNASSSAILKSYPSTDGTGTVISGTDTPISWSCHFFDTFNDIDTTGIAYVTCR
ncbi:hypothetical protein QUF50_02950, partial [Thiotrichales bacterium HSG1]|nr:hypothetical protein [Thiotrichales bacterium HSG1]